MSRSHEASPVPDRKAARRNRKPPHVSVDMEDHQMWYGPDGMGWSVPQLTVNTPLGGSAATLLAPSMMPSRAHSPAVNDDDVDLTHRGELNMAEKYNYDLAKAQLKASSKASALLAGFAMIALVELQYQEDTPRPLLILLGVVTSLMVAVHLLALMMSTCILPYMDAAGCTQDSPHVRLKFYVDLSWIFSTCIGLLLFLIEINIIFFVKFDAIGFRFAGYLTTALLVPVEIVFCVFSYLIHKNRVSHSIGRFKSKVDTIRRFMDIEAGLSTSAQLSTQLAFLMTPDLKDNIKTV